MATTIETRTRSGRIIKKPQYYIPEADFLIDDDDDGEFSDSDGIDSESECESCSSSDESDADDNGNLDGFIVNDEEDDDDVNC